MRIYSIFDKHGISFPMPHALGGHFEIMIDHDLLAKCERGQL